VKTESDVIKWLGMTPQIVEFNAGHKQLTFVDSAWHKIVVVLY
jgi:hypothetical protein